MRKHRGSILYSPTDLIRFMESPFGSWMERLRLADPSRAIPDEKSDAAELIAKIGVKHEAKFLDSLRGEGRDIASIPKDHFEQALDLTRQAIQEVGFTVFFYCQGGEHESIGIPAAEHLAAGADEL